MNIERTGRIGGGILRWRRSDARWHDDRSGSDWISRSDTMLSRR
jgi:hypothetical protein